MFEVSCHLLELGGVRDAIAAALMQHRRMVALHLPHIRGHLKGNYALWFRVYAIGLGFRVYTLGFRP
jgi:hypothetical protein